MLGCCGQANSLRYLADALGLVVVMLGRDDWLRPGHDADRIRVLVQALHAGS